MHIEFATSCRSTALRFLQSVYPSQTITDTPDSAGPLLDLVERDVMRVQDPMMYGSRIAIVPGKNFDESQREDCTKVCAALYAKLNSEAP
jgi:hypothetical protein